MIHFLFATLLLCIRHIEKNVLQKFAENATDTKKNEVMTTLFGNDSKKGLVDSQSIEEFETEVPQFYASLSLEKNGEIFYVILRGAKQIS